MSTKGCEHETDILRCTKCGGIERAELELLRKAYQADLGPGTIDPFALAFNEIGRLRAENDAATKRAETAEAHLEHWPLDEDGDEVTQHDYDLLSEACALEVDKLTKRAEIAEKALAEHIAWAESIDLAELGVVQRERDEARAEIERLLAGHGTRTVCDHRDDGLCADCAGALRIERDTAREQALELANRVMNYGDCSGATEKLARLILSEPERAQVAAQPEGEKDRLWMQCKHATEGRQYCQLCMTEHENYMLEEAAKICGHFGNSEDVAAAIRAAKSSGKVGGK